MSIIKLFGSLDILTALTLLISQFTDIHSRLIFTAALYLYLKGLLFLDDPASILDIIIGTYCIFIIFVGPVMLLTLPCTIFLLQKGIYSLI